MERNKISKHELERLLALHRKFLALRTDGKKMVLTCCDLSGMDLSGLNMSRARFIGCDMRNCDLSGSDLSWADVSFSDLTGADLTGVNLTGANIRNVTHIRPIADNNHFGRESE